MNPRGALVEKCLSNERSVSSEDPSIESSRNRSKTMDGKIPALEIVRTINIWSTDARNV